MLAQVFVERPATRPRLRQAGQANHRRRSPWPATVRNRWSARRGRTNDAPRYRPCRAVRPATRACALRMARRARGRAHASIPAGFATRSAESTTGGGRPVVRNTCSKISTCCGRPGGQQVELAEPDARATPASHAGRGSGSHGSTRQASHGPCAATGDAPSASGNECGCAPAAGQAAIARRDASLSAAMRSPPRARDDRDPCHEIMRVERLVDDERIVAIAPGAHARRGYIARPRPHREPQHVSIRRTRHSLPSGIARRVPRAGILGHGLAEPEDELVRLAADRFVEDELRVVVRGVGEHFARADVHETRSLEIAPHERRVDAVQLVDDRGRVAAGDSRRDPARRPCRPVSTPRTTS